MLSKLEPEAAARVARQMTDSYGVAAALGETDDPESPKIEPQQPENDSAKPSFMHTEYRMTIGRELLEREKKPDK